MFGRQGFHATSLEEIAQAAGFTRGAIYKNFKSKEEIIIAVVEWHVERQLATYADALEDAGASTSDRVSAAAEVWAGAFRRDPELTLLELELYLHALRNPDFRERLAAWKREQLDQVASFIDEQCRATGLRLTVPAAELGALALAGVEGLSMAASIHTEASARYDRLVELFFRMVSELIVEAGPRSTPEKAKPSRPRR